MKIRPSEGLIFQEEVRRNLNEAKGSKGKKMAKRSPKIFKGSQNDVRRSQNGQKDLCI
jgi:hypothetical protein